MLKSQADSKNQSPTLGRHNIPWYTAVVSVLHVYTYYILYISYKLRNYFHKANYLLHVEKTTALLQFYFHYLSSSSPQDFIPHFHKDY